MQTVQKDAQQPILRARQLYHPPDLGRWIFAESRRRTACVFFLMYRCIFMTTGIDGCDAFYEFTDLPLVSRKTVWEARTRPEWEVECSASAAAYEPGMHTTGILVDAHQRSSADVSKATLLDIWNARADNLGELLNIVSSII